MLTMGPTERQDEMGRIAIAVNGKQIFVWNGDEASIKNILDAFPRGARGVGMAPHALADTCVAKLSSGSLLSTDPVGQEFQMMGVICASSRKKPTTLITPASLLTMRAMWTLMSIFKLVKRVAQLT